MTSNKYTRHQPSFTSQSDVYGDEYWAAQVENNLNKSSVTSRQNSSLFDQITSIMDGAKSKFTTVESKVEDMKERAGLNAYLKNINKSSNKNVSNHKTMVANIKSMASENNFHTDDTIPIFIKQHPNLLSTLENIIKDTKGSLSIPAIIAKLKSIHKNDLPESKDWNDPKLMHLVSKLNLAEKTNHYNSDNNQSNLGKQDSELEFDQSNDDAFSGLMPAKVAEDQSYYDSAEGMQISRHRAEKECHQHHSSFTDMIQELGDKEEYDAQEVLRYLGY
jgi:hypothetical protein